jgi:hypothetical protein
MYWLPRSGTPHLREAMRSDWGHLFANWGKVQPDPDGRGFPDVGVSEGDVTRTGVKQFMRGLRLVGMAVRESPEFLASRRKFQR